MIQLKQCQPDLQQTLLHDAEGNVERLVGFVVDLTPVHAHRRALTEALEDLATQKAFTDAVLETVDVGIVYADVHGQGMTRNRAQREMLGLPADYEGGPEDAAPLIDFLDDEGRAVRPEDYSLFRVLRGEDPPPLECRMGPRGGPHRSVVVRADRITGSRGEVLGAVTVLSDVTAERSAVRALEQRTAALDEAQRLGRQGPAGRPGRRTAAGAGSVLRGAGSGR